MKRVYRVGAAFLCGILLLMTACSKLSKRLEKETVGGADVSTEPTASTMGAAALNSLRQAMVETPQIFAVAYFGYHDTIDSDLPVDPFVVMQDNAPQLCADLPFLLEIPRDRVIGENGDLFCVLPLDEDATVAVSKGIWDENSETYLYEDSLYFSETGEPILFFCNNAVFEPDTQLYISGPSGTVIWYPQIDDNQCAMPMRNENWENLFYDFSPYREMLIMDHREMQGEWIKPTAEMLTGSTWVWNGYSTDGREIRYRMTFGEDTLSVRWNDGIDPEDHEYPDADWKLIDEEGYKILSIDFREFAGNLRYNLLYHEDYELLYVGMDVVQSEMPIGWEPLCRFMMPPSAPEPVDMLGDWELAWTEVEGYRENIEPGTESISIFLNDDNGFRITLTDTVFSHKSFYNKELGVYEGELYSGCGNDQWMCYIGYMGAEDTIYSLTLTQDDILLMEMYWEIDGGTPMVAHKWYRRASW